MGRTGLLLMMGILYYGYASGQLIKEDTPSNAGAGKTVHVQNDNSKIQLQQQLLLGRQQQLDLNRDEQQKILLEKQKAELAEKEKQLLELKIQKKQNELEQGRKTQAQILQKNQLEARIHEAEMDKQINAQQAEIGNNRKWNLFLTILFVIVVAFASITYYSQRKTKRLNAVISCQHDELEKMGMVKDTLLSVVSHDLREPVNNLLSFTELMKEGMIKPDRLELYLNQINLTLHHTSSLMNNLLNWSASQMQGFKTVIQKVDAGFVAESLELSFSDRIEAKKIIFINKIAIGTLVMADANMMELVIRNLISNALKYTSANGSITIAADHVKDVLVISVTDTGVGMPQEKMNLFNSETISQAESTIGTAKEKGAGLGLLLCKTFSRLMNGSMTVQANPAGRGCRFELTLPKP